MNKLDALRALAALAQDSRLDAYRLLVEAGPDGMPAGEVADVLGLPPNTLTFHLGKLRDAGLVEVERNGRSMIYRARFATMNALIAFLTENCCGGRPDRVAPRAPSVRIRKKEAVRCGSTCSNIVRCVSACG